MSVCFVLYCVLVYSNVDFCVMMIWFGIDKMEFVFDVGGYVFFVFIIVIVSFEVFCEDMIDLLFFLGYFL